MPFELISTRELMENIGFPPVIEERICSLERAVQRDSNDAFDHSKALVESVCKTILLDRGVQVDSGWDLPKFIKEVLNTLPIVSASHPSAGDARERIKTIIRGLMQTVQGLAEMRNLGGWISHGPNGYMEPLDKVHIRLTAMSADTLVCFLLSVHKKFLYPHGGGRIHYEDYIKFNESIDEAYGEFQILDSIYRPSEVLYMADIDHVAYKEYLIEFLSQPQEDMTDSKS